MWKTALATLWKLLYIVGSKPKNRTVRSYCNDDKVIGNQEGTTNSAEVRGNEKLQRSNASSILKDPRSRPGKQRKRVCAAREDHMKGMRNFK